MIARNIIAATVFGFASLVAALPATPGQQLSTAEIQQRAEKIINRVRELEKVSLEGKKAVKARGTEGKEGTENIDNELDDQLQHYLGC